MAAKAKSKRGGRRPGAGRKPELEERVSVTLYLERADADALDEVAVEEGASRSSLIRKILNTYLKRRGRL